MKKNIPWLIGVALMAGIVGLFRLAFAFSLPPSESPGADAIAVRIIPNPNHYSISRWYESQGFAGSPQSLVVDGYEAIRDGRTVYVNAANVDNAGGNKTVYTNIYLISYNQNPVPNTVDILGQIIAHWKFNNNLPENIPSSCAISSLSCRRDSDCVSGQFCATSTAASSSCQLKTTKNCLVDTDCPINFFCNSEKAKITRDLKRVGKLEELKEALFNYKTAKGLYPALSAGSYLSAHTMSVWPSWTESFLSPLALSRTFSDPINRLGDCPGYDLKTCWDKDNKAFWNNQNANPETGIANLILPPGSYSFVYQTDRAGSNYNICAAMESRDLGYHFSPNDPTSSNCVVGTGINTGGSATNTAPRLVTAALSGVAGQEFNGFIKVVDDQNNPLSWSLNTSGTNWNGWQNGTFIGPILKDTNSANQKKVYASVAGLPGNYNAILTVNDGQGGILSTTTVINIINPAPSIQAADGEYNLSPLTPFSYNFIFSGANIINPASSFTVTRLSGPFDLLNSAGIIRTVSSAGVAKYKVEYQGIIPLSQALTQTTSFSYRITVTDKYGTSATKRFNIRIIVDKPALGFNCDTKARMNKPYSCLIGYNKQGEHTLAYGANQLPSGLSLVANVNNQNNNNNNQSTSRAGSFLSFLGRLFGLAAQRVNVALGAVNVNLNNFVGGGGGNTIATNTPLSEVSISGVPEALFSGFPITIQAYNEYGASSSRSFTLRIDNYCGDGHKQNPNTEGRGGLYNDGYEDCDGADSVSLDPSQANNPQLQYGCMTGVGAQTPKVIPNGNYCVFRSPVDGGGFCGDGYCQLEIQTAGGPVPVEDSGSCNIDCSPGQNNPIGCPGANQHREGQICVCNTGWYNCDGNASNGCESNSACLPSCQAHQHLSGSSCICDSGWYDCDGVSSNGCESNSSCSSCTPNCLGRQCGDDGCGGSCGTCPSGETCFAPTGKCKANCTPNCPAMYCGSDGCGGFCNCASGQVCSSNDLCCTFSLSSCFCGVLSSAQTRCGNNCCDDTTEKCCRYDITRPVCIPKNDICGEVNPR